MKLARRTLSQNRGCRLRVKNSGTSKNDRLFESVLKMDTIAGPRPPASGPLSPTLNSPRRLPDRWPAVCKPGPIWIVALMLLTIAGCAPSKPPAGVYGPAPEAGAANPEAPFVLLHQEVPEDLFAAGPIQTASRYASETRIAEFSASVSSEYRLGPGDRFAFQVRGREDISVPTVVVAPDGQVALPRIGILNMQGLSLAEATRQVQVSLERYYEYPDVTLVMQEYNNNRVYVLGRVSKPGAVHFQGAGTVLEALALAGGLPVDTQKTFLSRCMVVRGNEMVLWIDLRDLLENGNMALNARMQNGDILFIPQSDDAVAYMMGEVRAPGVLLLRSQMTVLDALMHAGGVTEYADLRRVYLVRSQEARGVVMDIDLTAFIERGDLRRNYILREGDILYVGQRGMGHLNYFLTQLLPSLRIIDFTFNTAERLGAMQQLRQKIWGQEGFVNPAQQ